MTQWILWNSPASDDNGEDTVDSMWEYSRAAMAPPAEWPVMMRLYAEAASGDSDCCWIDSCKCSATAGIIDRATDRKPPCTALPWSARKLTGGSGLYCTFVVQSLIDDVPRMASTMVVVGSLGMTLMSIAFVLERQFEAITDFREDDDEYESAE